MPENCGDWIFRKNKFALRRNLLEKKSIPVKLFLSSMDENPGIPENYFDLVVSIYSLGWTPDLSRTLDLVHSYLKPGGVFIFSWRTSCLSVVEL